MVKHNHIIPTRKHGKHGYACWFRRSTCKTKGGRIARQQSKTTEVFLRQHTTNAPLGCPGIKFRQLKACTRRIPDLISELPDDILVKILSLVPIKEAAKTSVLSKRWVHAWAYIPILNFDPGNIHDTLWVDSHTFNNVKFVTEELRYIRWVNGVVRSHKASTVDKFRLLFYLQDDRKRDIDNWIRFAMEKRVKRLELDFTGYGRELRCLYNLPTFSSLCSSLTSLQLASVNVSGEALERFISNCRGLEYISVKQSKLLVELKITGPSLNLKSLQIVDCWKIKFLEISAPSLRSFYYEGPKLNLSFRSTPKIAEVSICGFHAEHLVYDYSDFLNCASQIEVLTLDFPVDIHVMEVFPICTRLKVLNLSVPAECEEDLFHFSSLIKACPLLHKFVLQLDYLDKLRFKKKRKRKREREPCPHNHLKIVEIVGFLGGKVDAGFVKYLLDIAVSLQKIIFDTRNPPSNVDRDEKTIKKATKVANQMRANIRRGIEVVIC